MSTTESNEQANASATRRRPDGRNELEESVTLALKRMPYGRLRMMNSLSQSDTARVYAPRSSHGLTLFNRIEALDEVFASCERKVMRNSHSSDAFEQKTSLDRSMFDLNHCLIDMAAQMAIKHGVDDRLQDAVTIKRVHEFRDEEKREREEQKREAAAAKQLEKSDQIRKPGRRSVEKDAAESSDLPLSDEQALESPAAFE